jgi:hypothetical protein
MMADDILLRPVAGFLELLGCRAKRRDLARSSFIVPSVGEFFAICCLVHTMYSLCTYYARIAAEFVMKKARVFGESPKSAENAGAHTNLGISYGADPPLHLPCTGLFRKRFPATFLPHLAVQLTEGAPCMNVFYHARNFPAAGAITADATAHDLYLIAKSPRSP